MQTDPIRVEKESFKVSVKLPVSQLNTERLGNGVRTVDMQRLNLTDTHIEQPTLFFSAFAT